MRWFRDAWDDATELNKAGKQIIAVTSWAMLGASNWSSLATEDRGDFESGAFDPRAGNARPTGVAAVITAASQGGNMPLASNGKGWWQRTDRLHYRPVAIVQRMRHNTPIEQTRPLLIAGATGTLGQALLRAARARGLYAVATSRAVMTLDCAKSVAAAIERYRPWAVINACGWVRVDEAEAHIDACNRSNVLGPITLAAHCDRLGIPNVHFSSDLVFDGQSSRPYFESDPVAPLNVYGRSKAAADAALLAIPTALVIRTAAFFSPFDAHNFAIALVESLRRDSSFGASSEHRITPTYVPHLSNFVLDILIDGETGLWHASNGEELSWHEFAFKLAIACQLDAALIEDATKTELGWLAERPLRSSLASKHGCYLPNLDQAIHSFAREILTTIPTAKKACR
jgi:dTDP-4-dehydrorhamnose reductase